jgi:mycothiol system anti-sigma-R factor
MNASCEESLERIELLLDGELGPDELARLRRHLEDCAPCVGQVEVLERLRERLRTDCCESPPEHLVTSVRASIAALRMVEEDGDD